MKGQKPEERRVGKECNLRVDLGGRRIIKKKKNFFQAEDGIRDCRGDWSSDVCSSDLRTLCPGISRMSSQKRACAFQDISRRALR